MSCRLLLFSGVFRRKFDKNIFERRPNLMNFHVADTGAVQLFFNVRALDAFIDKQMHRLTKHSRAPHAAELMNSLKRRRDMIAGHIEPPCPRRIHLRHLL